MEPKGKRETSVTALARGLSILQCFDHPGAQLTVSEIARRVGLSQPTAWRLCSTLIEKGFLVKAPGGAALRVGAPAMTLGYAAIQGQDLPALARPYMDQLTAEARVTVSLSLCNGTEMLAVDQTIGSFVVPGQPIGWRASLASSSGGLAVLGILPPDQRRLAIEKIAAQNPAAWPRRKARIDRAAAYYADHDYIIVTDMFDGQYAATAIALIEGSGQNRRYWGLACSGLSTTWNEEALKPVGERLKRIRDLLQPAAAAMSVPAG
ncbi:helix-turn-helix domain-containing protein [Sphingobium sp. HBC34]|uniref:Helix-turn-helix domain-containing protein n=1 Tax=Sphingobium cyanobacteriorum TaxID=3063954 RepID=A0ABT8ZPD5_9SPHN|nr:helix-turn-helix domain-containing protein [Sphingobium sp. HBC34]MDO7836383.1 helix-turn-helix domain-containing protein [Sphingobium sp. HBC34]